MPYECPVCQAEFDIQTAYCEDWRIKDKSFGCPKCKTFFKEVTVGKPDYTQYVYAVFSAVVIFNIWPYIFSDCDFWLEKRFFISGAVFFFVSVRVNRYMKDEIQQISS